MKRGRWSFDVRRVVSGLSAGLAVAMGIARTAGRWLLASARAVWSGLVFCAVAVWRGAVYLVRLAFLYAPITSAIIVGGLSYSAKLFDSFNLADSADGSVEKATSLVTGPFYGNVTREGQNAITVVLINPRTMAKMENPFWPLRYDNTASMVEAVAAMKPRAIFLDLVFRTPQPPRPCWPKGACDANPDWELNDLARRLRAIEASGIPVILGPVGDDPAFAELAKLRQAGIGFNDDRSFAYPLLSNQAGADGAFRPMAALVLYDLWREGEPGASRRGAPPADAVLSVDWGFGMSSAMARYSPEARERAPCRGATPAERADSFGRLAVNAAFPVLRGPDPFYVPCAYSDILPGYAVLAPALRKQLSPLVEDRIVLIGADVPSLRDYTPTPLFGETPGVMIHAMALDNLIEGGAKATRYPGPFQLGLHNGDPVELGLDNGDLVELGLLALGLALVWLTRIRRRVPVHRRLRWRHRIAIWTIVACVGVTISCLLHWPMFKLVGAAITGAGAMALSDFITRFFDLRRRHRAVRLAARKAAQA